MGSNQHQLLSNGPEVVEPAGVGGVVARAENQKGNEI
jgi:hypothetical protein